MIDRYYEIIFLILNYKTYEETIKLAKELIAYENFGSKYGLVIVDNASPNESWQELQYALSNKDDVYLLLSEENGGYACGNNVGLRFMEKCPPKYVCIINNDVHFTEKAVQHLMEVYERLPNAGILTPIQKLPNGCYLQTKHELPTFVDDLLSVLPYSLKKRNPTVYLSNTNKKNLMEVDIVQGAFVFMAYKLMQCVGFYDECTFLFCEERILTHKVQAVGKKNYILLDETYLHQHSLTINSETSELQRRELLFKGKMVYSRNYRKLPYLKSLILWAIFILSTPLVKLRLKLRR